MLPPDLKLKVANHCRKEGISLGQYIRESLLKALDSDDVKLAGNDPLFLDNAVFEGSIPEDLASNHDQYLYGEDH